MIDTHCEKNLIINNRELKYKGIFLADELFSVINHALEERGYEKKEKKTEEMVTEEGRRTYVELRPYKEKSNYAALMIKIKITLDHVTDVVEKVQGVKRKFQQGDVEIIFDAWSLTDYEQRWGMKPWVYFTKGIINKFIYKFPLERGFIAELGGDTAYVYAHIKNLLQSYSPREMTRIKEEDIRKKMEEEIGKGE
ncbi:MAG: hypothetical protein QT02_C0006G0028 [archaeon GW2011_AR9]|nr:MAG: hypothetical protein QT02_C0006G0028 [archaeon GW2011_AR9]MBS3120454.1 hypothetical protein [Candidatus Woesearchaeota archaeon]HIG93754.1 hypothetical protein [Candidatus Woesearchaeota archaeon]HIH12611.1 hypothetical protein [Candidatus Woesearchaeota archaeon]